MSNNDSNTHRKHRAEDTIKILLATDIHLGYEQTTKRVQESDSFITFEEILQQALKFDVDFLLLGGDLFHDSKPTQKVILRCMELLKKYVLGDRKLRISFLSNPEAIFPHASEKTVNFEDPNMNIALPIFSIHGNHDNPSFDTTGSMDVLGASGLINYFGKWADLTNISIPPLLFNKGKTHVSVYGLSHINDQRLSRLLRDDQLFLLQPAGIPNPFKIMVLHQNRSKHTENGFIPENGLPNCLDLVFWGHEHECRLDGEFIGDISVFPPMGYWITQPGSSVATSLCPGEAREKKIGLLKVNKRQFKLESIKLETVRPFVFDDLHLDGVDFQTDLARSLSDSVFNYVDEYIEHILLPKAKDQLTGNPNQPKVPLIRLRIFYTQDGETFDVFRLSHKYADKVANPRDMIIFRKQKTVTDDKKNILHRDDDAGGDISECFRTSGDDDWSQNIQDGIRNYFARHGTKGNLKGLSVDGLNEALRSFVEVGDDEAFKHIVNHQAKKIMEYLKEYGIEEEPDIIAQLENYREERSKADGTYDEQKEAKKLLMSEAEKSRKKPRVAVARDDSDEELSDDADDGDRPATRSRGRGSRGGGGARARGSRGGATTARGTARGRAKAAAPKSHLDVSVSTFAPKANSSIRDSTSSSAMSFFRKPPTARTSTQSEKAHYIDDSDSD